MQPWGPTANQLDTSSLAIGLYLVVALAFAIPTYKEGCTSRDGRTLWRVAGLLLCLAWPALIALVAIELFRTRRPMPARTRDIVHR